MASLFNPAGRDVSGAILGGLQAGNALQQGGLVLERAKAGQQGLLAQDEIQFGQAGEQAELSSLIRGAQSLSVIPSREGQLQNLIRRNREITDRGGNPEHTQEGIQLLQQGMQTGDFAPFDESINDIISLGREISRPGAASARAFAPDTIRKVVGKDKDGNDVFGLFSRQIVFDPVSKTSEVIETPIEGELVTSTGETIKAKRLGEVEAEGLKAESKAVGKSLGEAKTAPLVAKTRSTIETAVKLAQADATSRGETLTDLARMEAALPGLRDVVGQLKELSLIATSTFGGRAFDFAVKESGFGSTKGANARSKFISIVNNQVLPLLKPTFGGAFSVQEGAELKATLGDPNASPQQKIDQLNAFIDQKVRGIQGEQRGLGQDVTATEELATGTPLFSTRLNQNITETDIQETLRANPGTTREQILQQLGVQ